MTWMFVVRVYGSKIAYRFMEIFFVCFVSMTKLTMDNMWLRKTESDFSVKLKLQIKTEKPPDKNV